MKYNDSGNAGFGEVGYLMNTRFRLIEVLPTSGLTLIDSRSSAVRL